MTPSKETRRAEGRGQPEGNSRREAKVRTQSRPALPPNLARVNAAARQAAQTRFTALLHHIDIAALERAFRRQKRLASAGVDGMTVAAYEQDLETNLRDLCTRVHTRRYRPQPVRRVYIPKADGGRRPLGVPTLEDKIVQGAVAELLSAVYEVDFLGFSYRLPTRTKSAYGSVGAAYGADEPAADSGGSRPRIRDDVARQSDLMSLGVPR